MTKTEIMRKPVTFILLDETGKAIGEYTGEQPRDAALKAARRGHTKIILKATRTKKLHFFKGERVLVPVPESAPEWIKKSAAKRGNRMYKALVKKIGVGHMVKTRISANPQTVFKFPTE